MAGYAPHIRVTPLAGPTIDLNLESYDSLATQKLFAEPVFRLHDTLTRRTRITTYGWRLRMVLEWEIRPGSLDEANPDNEHATSGVVGLTRHLLRNDTKLELNLGGTTIYRECVLSDWSRNFVDEKHILGLWRMELTCVDLISEDGLPPEAARSPGGLMSWTGVWA